MLAHRMKPAVPFVEISDDADSPGIGGPHGKQRALDLVDAMAPGAEQLIGTAMLTGMKGFHFFVL